MSPSFVKWLAAPMHLLDSVDSTNNYAMLLLNASDVTAGTTIVTRLQTEGKGQRGNRWTSSPDESVLMSVIVCPQQPLEEQFIFSAAIATTIIQALHKILPNARIEVKWPNDIFINDKKAGGILIENIIRGSIWQYAVVGVGVNVNQKAFPADLPMATSIVNATGEAFSPLFIRDLLREAILQIACKYQQPVDVMVHYNEILYQREKKQLFLNESNQKFEATILSVKSDGTLELRLDSGEIKSVVHGSVKFIFDNISA